MLFLVILSFFYYFKLFHLRLFSTIVNYVWLFYVIFGYLNYFILGYFQYVRLLLVFLVIKGYFIGGYYWLFY
jgi:hypothetical protein